MGHTIATKTVNLVGHLGNGKQVLVSASDYDRVMQHRWQLMKDNMVITGIYNKQTKKTQTIRMHRFLLEAPNHLVVDHINGNRLDNRRSNIRLCTTLENQWNRKKTVLNTSGYKGVTWDKLNRKWRAQIRCEGKRYHLGLFKKIEQAAQAYDTAAIKYHGSFASLNLGVN